ncbi:tRNA pseudouridine(38-40) synthase TruA [Planctomycetota bacterium]|nr:tRNA pseudouridine(38-40) synthase TruA [Planctomycetota bacterium]
MTDPRHNNPDPQSDSEPYLGPEPQKHRYKLTVAYDGSDFFGWQKQEPPDQEPLRTVQGVLEQALIRKLKQPIILTGASRTDSGVHALGQVAHFDATTRIPVENLAHAVNGCLPPDIDIRKAEITTDDFQSILGAKNKQYRYRFYTSRHRPLGFRNLVYHTHYPLDPTRMQDAANRLVGEHDFEGFATAGHGRESTVRTIYSCDIEINGEFTDIVVTGNGFLWNQIRIIAGTLLEVGRGHFEPDRIDEIIRTTDRQLAGPTLPPSGLTLEWISYETRKAQGGDV